MYIRGRRKNNFLVSGWRNELRSHSQTWEWGDQMWCTLQYSILWSIDWTSCCSIDVMTLALLLRSVSPSNLKQDLFLTTRNTDVFACIFMHKHHWEQEIEMSKKSKDLTRYYKCMLLECQWGTCMLYIGSKIRYFVVKPYKIRPSLIRYSACYLG